MIYNYRTLKILLISAIVIVVITAVLLFTDIVPAFGEQLSTIASGESLSGSAAGSGGVSP